MMDIAVVGLGVMGQNLALNMAGHGFSVSGIDIDSSKTFDFVEKRVKQENIIGFGSIAEAAASLSSPKKFFLMVPAGAAVDSAIEIIMPYLSKGDIIIDGGNSFFKDTARREKAFADLGILFIGTGVSGGEEGALNGPSLMPGGNINAWEYVKDIFEAISAKTDEGEPCAAWVGNSGAGHFVKMVHNGIEYGDMELICETYAIMRNMLGMGVLEIADIFKEWNKRELDSYLIEITSNILREFDPETGLPMVDVIKDTAGQKGTGAWTGLTALELGIAAPTIVNAVFARCLSAVKNDRIEMSRVFDTPRYNFKGNKTDFLESLYKALYVAKVCSYSQGFSLMKEASIVYNWNLNFSRIAQTWRAGCIIRAAFLSDIREAFESSVDFPCLMAAPFFAEKIKEYESDLRLVVSEACLSGVSVLSMGASLSYFDGIRSQLLPANLLQAQRDYFGAHTFERLDKEGKYHYNWF